GIIHPTEIFRAQMEIIARHFHPVSLDEVLQFVKDEKNLMPRSVMVTFDDGYVDNYDVARPVLDKVGVPGVFYVAVDSIDRQTLPWPARLRHIFLTGDGRFWNDRSGNQWPLRTREERLRAYTEAARLCAKLSGQAQRDLLDSAAAELRARAMAPRQPMMS